MSPTPTTPTAFATPTAALAAAPISHYENFPVASWLCPPRLRPPIAAIYHFARTADDIADEGNAAPAQRLQDLAQLRADLHAVGAAQPHSQRWPQVFDPLAVMIRAFDLPIPLLADLLDAFCQDVCKTRDGAGYADRYELLDYCRRSANPVGRLLLHLYGVRDEPALRMSDHICSALQLINFWQDLSQDIPRGRYYLPASECAAYGVTQQQLLALQQSQASTRLIAAQVEHARLLMLAGAPLVHRVPGRAGWELRLVVQGGLRIAQRIAASNYSTLQQRPKLGRIDLLRLLGRALWM